MNVETNQCQEEEEDDNNDQLLLEQQIIEIIQKSNFKLTAATLSTQLLSLNSTSLSIDEAESYLCHLLSDSGSGSFSFTKIENQNVMVFEFDSNFVSLLQRRHRKETFNEVIFQFGKAFVTLLRAGVGFLVLFIFAFLTVTAIVAVVTFMIALMTQQRNNHSPFIGNRRLRRLCFTLRELMFLYAIFGDDSSVNPFFRDIAWLFMMSPFHPFFWFRFSRTMSRRRNNSRQRRRLSFWQNNDNNGDDHHSYGQEGLSLLQTDRTSSNSDTNNSSSNMIQGDLSAIIVLKMLDEFLFGSSSLWSCGPPEAYRWKLRAAVILNKLSEKASVHLYDLQPYVDLPKSNIGDESSLLAVLPIVSHFRGKPSGDNKTFIFPELMETDLDDARWISTIQAEEKSKRGFTGLLYEMNPTSVGGNKYSSSWMPSYLVEEQLVLTNLSWKNFRNVAVLLLANLIGTHIVRSYYDENIHTDLLSMKYDTLAWCMKYFLWLIAKSSFVFVLLPCLRLVLIIFLNKSIDGRNKCRKKFHEDI